MLLPPPFTFKEFSAQRAPFPLQYPEEQRPDWNWVPSMQRDVLRGQPGIPEMWFLILPGLLVGGLLGVPFLSSMARSQLGVLHAWAPPSAEGSEERQLQAPEPLKASLTLEAVAREKLTP